MDARLKDLLSEIENFGMEHDSRITEHSRQMLNITRDTGLFLSILIRSIKPKNVLEIGTSNAYSTLWIADAVRHSNGQVTTLEVSSEKARMARNNIERSGLSRYIDLHQEDVRIFLRNHADESYDFIFLDAERPQYLSYWRELDRVLKSESLLVVDNALSPHPAELAEFFKTFEDTHRFLTEIIHLGKGEYLAFKLES
jgi:predicted O-methyltransferase YrrM